MHTINVNIAFAGRTGQEARAYVRRVLLHEVQHAIQDYNLSSNRVRGGLRAIRNNESELEGRSRELSKEHVLDRLKKARRTSIGMRLYDVEGNLVNLKAVSLTRSGNCLPIFKFKDNSQQLLMKKLISILTITLLLFSCKEEKKEPKSETVVETVAQTDDWVYLFDGTSTDGWRGYNGKTLPPGWVIEDGALTFKTELGLEQDYEGGKDIIYAAEEFDNFELSLEWKIPEGGNSGIFYHLKEGYGGPPEVSPEYQLIDDLGYAKIHDLTEYNLSLGYTDHPEELKPLQQTGADYAMHPAPADKVLHPVGEWNSSKIVFTPQRVEHWLNGQMLFSFVPWDEAWYEKKNSDKWKNAEDYGKFKTGFIGLQDHASPIWFRNIKIKKR